MNSPLEQALALRQAGRHAEALALAQRAVATDGRDAGLHVLIGQALAETGQPEGALANLDRAVAMAPGHAEAHYERALVLHHLLRDPEALAAIELAVALRPDLLGLHAKRAEILRDLGRPAEALASIEHVLAKTPNDADAHANRGVLLDECDRPAEALTCYERALALRPDTPAALAGRGQLRMDAGNLGAARHDLEAAVRLAPGSDNAAFALSQLQLLEGEWPAGWTNYERRNNPRRPAHAVLPFPRWNGEAPDGTRLVLVTEQGLGDMIQFCRFAPWLAARGHRVTILTLPSMVPLLSTLSGVEVVESIEARRDDAIRWAPLMSVPRLTGLTIEAIPSGTPYLSADPERIALWRTRLGDTGFKIAIAWQGRPNQRMDRGRSMPLAALAPLAALPGVRLISLQKHAGSEQIASFPGLVETLGPDFDAGDAAFLDAAAVMAVADLVVSTDTSIPHLAGALGRPTMLALRHIPDWRWLLGRDDTPWYPTMRLFRQTVPGDWSGVCRRIADAVSALQA